MKMVEMRVITLAGKKGTASTAVRNSTGTSFFSVKQTNTKAASAMEILAESGSKAEIAAMESELAADRKATKNIMTAIEQGIFTATTKDRLLELELEISTLEKSIAIARAASEETAMEKERIIWSLGRLRDGDVTSKEYQKRLFDTFVKAVYIWDDKIEIHYYYNGEGNVLTSSLKEAAGGGGPVAEEVLISSPEGHHERIKQTFLLQGRLCRHGLALIRKRKKGGFPLFFHDKAGE